MPGRLKAYAFINAKLRARLSKLLSEDFIEQMVRAPSFPEAIQLLRGTPFQAIEESYRLTGDLKLGELNLYRQEVAVHLEVEALIEGPARDFVHALVVRYEIEALKNALRVWFDRTVRGRDIESSVGYLYRDRIHHDLHVDGIINLDSLEEIADLLRGTPYATLIRERVQATLDGRSLFQIEVALDQYFYRQLLEAMDALPPRDREIARRLVGIEVDLQNIDWVIRFKQTYQLSIEDALRYSLPFGQNVGEKEIRSAYGAASATEVLSELVRRKYPPLRPLLSAQGAETRSRFVLMERILDQILAMEVRRALSGYPFTIGIVLAYFLLKRRELKTIMTLLNAKYYRIPADRIEGLI